MYMSRYKSNSCSPLILVWKMRIAGREEQIQVSFTSQTKAQLSVLVCNQMQLSSCESVGTHYSVSLVCRFYFLAVPVNKAALSYLIWFVHCAIYGCAAWTHLQNPCMYIFLSYINFELITVLKWNESCQWKKTLEWLATLMLVNIVLGM